MHKRQLNRAEIRLTIEPQGPLLIKSGMESGDPTLPDMSFVRSNGQVYLPGSSLKGVLRSYCERILRTVRPENPRWCCNPFDEKDSCSRRAEGKKEKVSSSELYRDHSCLACRTFGSTAFASHLLVKDFYPVPGSSPKSEERTNVAIDRVLGSVAAGPFNMEVVVEGRFNGHIQLRNFELWQLGLVGLALRDLSEGRVRLGFARSRGLGEVKATVERVTLRYSGMELSGGGCEMRRLGHEDGGVWSLVQDGRSLVYGIGRLATPSEIEAYGYSTTDQAAVVLPISPIEDLIDVTHTIEGSEAVKALFRACVEDNWRARVREGR